jgi:hypothetical protein
MSVDECVRRADAPIRRPMVKSGLTRLRQPDGAVQFGVDPERSVLLTGLDAPTRRWMDGLDGVSDVAGLRAGAAEAGVGAGAVTELLDLLAGNGLLEDAGADCAGWSDLPRVTRDRLMPDLVSLTLLDPCPDGGRRTMSRRLAAHVEVRGGGRVGSAVAGLLEAAGVGTVRLVDPGAVRPTDLGPAGHRAERLGRPRGAAKSAPGEVDLVVLASDDGLPPSGDLPEGPHLVVGVCETGGVVGPLVVQGRSACLRCLDLSRTDRDPAWPVVQAQLRAGRSVLPIPACDVVLATVLAGTGALHALSFLDSGTAPSLDGTVHVRLPDGLARRRSWARHPNCGCGWADALGSGGG